MSDEAKKGAKPEPPERWSAQRNTEVVLRLLRGEHRVEVSREVQVAPPGIEAWQRIFLETGRQGLKRRGRDPTERELVRTRAKLGRLGSPQPCARDPGSPLSGFEGKDTVSRRQA